jgi:hypothetical protein
VCPTTYGSARKLATPSRSLIVRRDGLTVRLFTRYGQLNRIETRRLSLPLKALLGVYRTSRPTSAQFMGLRSSDRSSSSPQ